MGWRPVFWFFAFGLAALFVVTGSLYMLEHWK
jgi:hypothetical protein